MVAQLYKTETVALAQGAPRFESLGGHLFSFDSNNFRND